MNAHLGSTLLKSKDYEAIGCCVTSFSNFERLVGIIVVWANIDVTSGISEQEHRPAFQKVSKSNLSSNSKRLLEIVEQKPEGAAYLTEIREALENLISWRNFFAHGCFMRLSDGRLRCDFYHRRAWDVGEGPQTHTFALTEIWELSRSVIETMKYLYELFPEISVKADHLKSLKQTAP